MRPWGCNQLLKDRAASRGLLRPDQCGLVSRGRTAFIKKPATNTRVERQVGPGDRGYWILRKGDRKDGSGALSNCAASRDLQPRRAQAVRDGTGIRQQCARGN